MEGLADKSKLSYTCKKYDYAIRNLIWNKESFDVYIEYYLPYSQLMERLRRSRSTLRAKKLVNFMQNNISDRLTHISMRKAPVLLSTTDLIRLAALFPSVTYLDMAQPNGDWPQFDNKVVYSLAYFKKLKTLKIDGTLSKRIVRRGGGHHDTTIFSIKVLSSLEHFEIDCHHDTLTTILKTMALNDTTLPYLKRVKFSVKHTSVSYPDQLVWFLSNHKNLEDVRIHNALFATIPQIEQFYSALCKLPRLKVLVLEKCSFCDRIDHNLQRQFYSEMKRKGVMSMGGVKNMRFDPDNNH
uniref:F-box domain-containing protein n=1 Tax=Steinernema glaseri TaxID=37863 RepID=A0A1I7XWB8_9BILA